VSRRHAALLAAGSALAATGLVVVLVVWLGLVTATLRTGLAADGGCVAAATAGEHGAEIGSTLLPPRAVCRWTVDGVATEDVLAAGSTAVVGTAGGVAVLGVAVVAVTAVAAVRARRRTRP